MIKLVPKTTELPSSKEDEAKLCGAEELRIEDIYPETDPLSPDRIVDRAAHAPTEYEAPADSLDNDDGDIEPNETVIVNMDSAVGGGASATGDTVLP